MWNYKNINDYVHNIICTTVGWITKFWLINDIDLKVFVMYNTFTQYCIILEVLLVAFQFWIEYSKIK